MASGENLHYRINEENKIIFVNSKWDQFAEANNGVNIMSSQILNRTLWDFISDRTTLNLYRELLQMVRNGRTVRFNFRCDSPTFRRFMEMEISHGENSCIDFHTHEVATESHLAPVLSVMIPHHSDKLIRICSWCKKIHTGELWVELEKAVNHMRLFENSELPTLTHGICDICYHDIKSIIKSKTTTS